MAILHVHGNPPAGLQWKQCVHKATQQRYVVLDDDASVETVHGTMAARAGDVLMEGQNGKYYVLTMQAFMQAYDY